MPVSYEELENSPRFTAAKDDFKAVRVLRIAWSDVQAFLLEMLGASSVVSGEDADINPAATFPGKDWLAVDTVDVVPFDPHTPGPPDADGVATYDSGARVTITYRPQPFDQTEPETPDDPDVPQGTFLTHRVSMSAHLEPLPPSSLVWLGDDQPVPDDLAAGLVVPTEEHILTWHFVPLPPWEAIRDLRGRVNNAYFLGYPPGTVLFEGMDARRDISFEGIRSWTLTYHFQVRSVPLMTQVGTAGWNYHFRSDAPGEPWSEVAHTTSGQTLYSAGDFSRLFHYDA